MATGSTDQGPPPPPSSCSWFWLGQEGQDQGPFPSFLMSRWLNNGLLPADSMIKREGDEEYASRKIFRKCMGPSFSDNYLPDGITDHTKNVDDSIVICFLEMGRPFEVYR